MLCRRVASCDEFERSQNHFTRAPWDGVYWFRLAALTSSQGFERLNLKSWALRTLLYPLRSALALIRHWNYWQIRSEIDLISPLCRDLVRSTFAFIDLSNTFGAALAMSVDYSSRMNRAQPMCPLIVWNRRRSQAAISSLNKLLLWNFWSGWFAWRSMLLRSPHLIYTNNF